MHHHKAQHQRGHTLGGDLVRPEVDQAPLLPDIAQFLEQADVAADSDQKVSPAVDDLLPIFIADEPRIGRDQRPLGQTLDHLPEMFPFTAVGGPGSPVPRQAGPHVPHDRQPDLGAVGLLGTGTFRPVATRGGLAPFAPLPRRRF